jgi:KipI family sensor histidine kinase inhibitor
MSDVERPEPRFLNSGEAALVVEYGQIIDPVIHDSVLALDAALNVAKIKGVVETVPTFRSLMIHYDPLQISRESLIAAILGLETIPASDQRSRAIWTIPCCYEGELGEDLGEIAGLAGLSEQRAAALHFEATYRVYMYGFAPGFCYLGGTPGELAVSRRATPRSPTRPNVVLVAGGLSLVSTVSMPTGWWIIGTTPERMYAPTRDPIFLVSVGDTVRFEPIDRVTFDMLERRAAEGETIAKRNDRE